MRQRAVRLAVALGSCLAGLALADTQVLVYKARQKPLVGVERSGSSSWVQTPVAPTGYLVVEVGGTGGIEAAKFLWCWTTGSERLYTVADPTTQGIAFLKLGTNGRALLWQDERLRAVGYGTVNSSTVYLANAYAGFWVDILEQPYGDSTRVNALAAAGLALRLDKTLSTQANVVHSVDAFVQVLVTGLENQGYGEADAKAR
jgi:hypothetical protein